MTTTLKDIEVAINKSIRPLNDLLDVIRDEYNSLKPEDVADIYPVQFLIGLSDLEEAAIFLHRKRDKIKKMIR